MGSVLMQTSCRSCQCYGGLVWPVWRVCCVLCKRIRHSISYPTILKPQAKMIKTPCIHRLCSVCSIGLPQYFLKIQLHCRRECWKRNWRFILPCESRLMGHHILNLAIFVMTAPRRKTFWFEQKWDLMFFWPCIMNWLYINYQLLCSEYYLFIKYESPLYVSSLKCSSSGGYSCTHEAYGTVTLYESSWWLVGTQLEWELTVGGRLLVGVLRHPPTTSLYESSCGL